MHIDSLAFTPWSALVGGALIGLAAVLMILFAGQIAGISGIVARLFSKPAPENYWRIAFTLGLLGAPLLFYDITGGLPEMKFETGPMGLIVAGLLVGFGSRLGSGCTSGHGVCGLSRLSLRSLAATVTFMATGFLTVWVIRHGFGG